MSTINELAKKYAKYLKEHGNSATVVEDLIKRIKSITHSDTGEGLSETEIDHLISEIEAVLNQTDDGLHYIVEAEDSSKLIQMVKMIRKGSKK